MGVQRWLEVGRRADVASRAPIPPKEAGPEPYLLPSASWLLIGKLGVLLYS